MILQHKTDKIYSFLLPKHEFTMGLVTAVMITERQNETLDFIVGFLWIHSVILIYIADYMTQHQHVISVCFVI